VFVINSNASRLLVGRHVIVIKTYSSGNTKLNIGDCGTITDEQFMDVPDLGLFNIRVLSLSFGSQVLHIGEQIIKEYLEVI
jgi:hypothetical protein